MSGDRWKDLPAETRASIMDAAAILMAVEAVSEETEASRTHVTQKAIYDVAMGRDRPDAEDVLAAVRRDGLAWRDFHAYAQRRGAVVFPARAAAASADAEDGVLFEQTVEGARVRVVRSSGHADRVFLIIDVKTDGGRPQFLTAEAGEDLRAVLQLAAPRDGVIQHILRTDADIIRCLLAPDVENITLA